MENTIYQYPTNINGDSWAFNQNRTEGQSQDWQYLPQCQYSSTNNNNLYQPNANFTQPNYFKSHSISNNAVPSDSWERQASIAKWEAYLISETPPSDNKFTQKPRIDNGSCLRKPTPPVTPRANHQGHISFIRSPDGVLKPIVKCKRKRTAFTTEQVQTLESIFHKRPYVSREERQILTERLQVSDKAVKVWFQNRRLKVKKEREEQDAEYSDLEIVEAEEINPLAYVEAQINRADASGYVTLDDRAIKELVSVIDRILPKEVDLSFTNADIKKPEMENELYPAVKSDNSQFYEPISPPDLSDEITDIFFP